MLTPVLQFYCSLNQISIIIVRILSEPKMSSCIDSPYSLSLRQLDGYHFELRNQFYMTTAEQVLVYVISPLVFITGIFNCGFFLKGKNKAEPPADILLFVSIFGMIRMASYITSCIFDEIYPPSSGSQVPQTFDDYCIGTGFVNIMCEISAFVYNIVFCIYYVVKIRNPLKSWIKEHRQLHIFCLVFIVLLTLVFFLTDLIGVSILGVCGYKIGVGIIYFDFGFSVVYFIVMVVSSAFFLKYLKTISKYDSETRVYFKFYFKYLVISSISSFVSIIALLVVTLKCEADSADTAFEVFSTICNMIRLISPIIVFAIIANHPQAKFQSILQFLKSFFGKQNEQQDNTFYEDLMTTKRTSMIVELTQLNSRKRKTEDFLSAIKDQNKACLLSTILGCLSIQENEFLEAMENSEENRQSAFVREKGNKSLQMDQLRISEINFKEQVFSWNFSDRYEFTLTEEIENCYSSIFIKGLPCMRVKFQAYCPAVFKHLQLQSNITDLYKKMLPLRNQGKIQKDFQTDGGASGQFFFFNYDDTLIIKTITSSELNVLMSRSEQYYGYFERNRISFIVRIYGLYKVINSETDEEIPFMLMGNLLSTIPRKYVKRSYDMKGSAYHRQVLKDEQLRQKVESTRTLKDIDFQAIEGMIHISKEDSQSIKAIMEQDTIFLYSQGLIDYSLIVLKIDYVEYLESEKPVKDLRMYKSTKEKGVVYVFGIIDYLETWNIRKQGEKWYKSIFNKAEGISSQDPKFYAERFMSNLIKVIFP